jgi:hypothetical protein
MRPCHQAATGTSGLVESSPTAFRCAKAKADARSSSPFGSYAPFAVIAEYEDSSCKRTLVLPSSDQNHCLASKTLGSFGLARVAGRWVLNSYIYLPAEGAAGILMIACVLD